MTESRNDEIAKSRNHGEWADVVAEGDIPERGLRVLVDDEEILVVRFGGGVRALSYLCSHQEMPLEGGFAEGGAWECPHHGARFDIATGQALSMPAVSPVKVFETRCERGRVLIRRDPA